MPETNEEKLILENLNYIGLNIKNIPDFLMNYKDVEYKPEKICEQTELKIYRYINLMDIQILLTPTSRTNNIVDKYSKAIPLCEYLKLENILDSELFSEMLKKIDKKEIEKIENEQKLAKKQVAFKVECETDDLWEIHYSELTGKYFMLVPIEDNYSAFFYLLKKQIECFNRKNNELIFVPIKNLDYTKRYLNNSEISDIEKYIWLFTKEWPKVYEVFDNENELSIHIVGETTVYDDIKSHYKIQLKTKQETEKFYLFLKALFVLNAELPHHYNFDTQINEKGELVFEFNNKLINSNNLFKFIKEEYKNKSKELQTIFEEKEEIDIELEKLKDEELEKNREYLFKEKQVSTYLECRKSMIGKLKYFFRSKTGKFQKLNEKKSRKDKLKEINEIEKSISRGIIEEKENYSIEDLVKICIELDRINLKIQNAKLDITAIKEKIRVLVGKIQNATLFIETIEEHKKSIFEFWKFSNKDLPLGLTTATEIKEEIEKEEILTDISIYLSSNDKLNLAEKREFYINPTEAINNIKEEKISLYKIKVVSPLEIKENQTKVEFDMSKYKIDLKKQKIFRTNYDVKQFDFKERIICVYEYEAKEYGDEEK